MTKRYYKATDGYITVFRATEERAYKSAHFSGDQKVPGGPWVSVSAISFSAAPPAKSMFSHATEEITQSEYETLQARKVTRIKAGGADPRNHTSPQASWVSNAALANRGTI